MHLCSTRIFRFCFGEILSLGSLAGVSLLTDSVEGYGCGAAGISTNHLPSSCS